MSQILLADDHDLVRETIAEFLARKGGHTVLQARDFPEAEESAAQVAPDLVLLDYAMPGMNGLSGLNKMIDSVGCPVALLTGTASAEIARAAFQSGAAGFLPKTLVPDELIAAVQLILGGEIYMPLDFMSKTSSEGYKLTPRETEVLREVSEGKSNKEIARDLGIQEVTVKLHVKTLSRKLGAKNRTHAAMIGRDQGLT